MDSLIKITHARMLTDESAAVPSSVELEVAGLFEQFRNPLFRYLLSLGLNISDGEEILQEVFLALFQHLKNRKPRTNLRGWIFRVGHNLALKLRQQRGTEAPQLEDCLADSDPNPEEQAATRQLQQRMSAVVSALPELDRACLSLRAEGFQYREISEICGMSLGSVSQSLERSLAKLSRVKER